MITLHRIILTLAIGLSSLSFGAEKSNSSSSNSGSPIGLQQNGGQQGNQNGNQNSRGSTNAPVSVVSDPAYRLSVGDQIAVEVYEEPDLTCNQLIDSKGIARLNDIGETKLTGLTVREAEHFIEETYKQRKILKRPVVTLVVTGFTPREVLVTGAVASPGPVAFSQDSISMPIVNVIYRAGGFKPGAKQDRVLVRRKDTDGRDITLPVNVESMTTARRKGDQGSEAFMVFPGDIINVDMSIF